MLHESVASPFSLTSCSTVLFCQGQGRKHGAVLTVATQPFSYLAGDGTETTESS
jgi:hypothetical protein